MNNRQHNWLALLPVLTACAMIQCILDGQQNDWSGLLAEFAVLGSVAVALYLMFEYVLPDTRKKTQWAVFLLLAALGIIWPSWSLAITRHEFSTELPLEVRCLLIMRNVCLLLAMFKGYARASSVAVLISGFLAIACLGLAAHPLLTGLSGVYVSAICLWMINRRHVKSAPSNVKAQSIPGYLGVVAVVATVYVLGHSWVDAEAGRTKLAQWLASSGGSLGYHESSTAGYGDEADPHASGEKAESTGPTNNNSYLESDLPSLYDAQVEAYGEPIQITQVKRAIPIFPGLDGLKDKKAVSDTQKKNTAFSTLRKSDSQGASGNNTSAQALLFVRGPSPAYIPLTYYDVYDGLKWHSVEEQPSQDEVLQIQDDNWIRRWEGIDLADSFPLVEYQVSVGKMDLSCLPLPYHVGEFRVGMINRVSFFNAFDNGLVEMSRGIPRGTMIESRHDQCIRRQSVAVPLRKTSAMIHANQAHRHAYHDLIDLACQWCEEAPAGWPEVDAIVEHLRASFTLDSAKTPSGHTDPIRNFLFDSTSGPDYLFASSAVMLLRTLGYETRLVSGFYVTPDSYNRRLGEHLVQSDDLHVWGEILLEDGCWVPIEATPGYFLPEPKQSFSSILLNAGEMLWAWLRSSLWITLFVFLLLPMIWLFRIRLADAICTTSWRLRHYLQGPDVYSTLRLLERRALLAGTPRPTGEPVNRWFESLQSNDGPDLHLTSFVSHLEQSAYARPSNPHRTNRVEVKHICDDAQRHWIISRFKTLNKRVQTR